MAVPCGLVIVKRTLEYTDGPARSQGPRGAAVTRSDQPEWQLPRGVTRGVWQYAHSDAIADKYDEYFALNRLFEFDEQVAARHFSRPGRLVDLGCGTGRALTPFARRGFDTLGVDLSMRMLRIVGEKAKLDGLTIGRVRANLVELDCLRDESFDYCLCLFSTLGMVRGRENRDRVLAHARRILKPGGVLVTHAHNLWYNVFDAAGRAWLARHLLECLGHRGIEWGDKFFDYRGVPRMFLHTYTRREFTRSLARAGFKIRELLPLHASRQRPLRYPWCFGRYRANGWVIVGERIG